MDKLFNKYYITYVIMFFINITSFNMTVTIVAKYVIHMGASSTLAGIIAGMFSLLALAVRPIVGFIADNANRKAFMLIGGLFSFVSFMGYGLSPSVEWVAFFRVTHSIGLSIVTTLTIVVCMDFVPKERTGEAMGYMGLASTVAMALGPSIGVWVLDLAGYEVTFISSAIVLAVGNALLIPLPVKTPPRQKHASKLSLGQFVHLPTLPLGFTNLGFSFACGVTNTALVLLADERAIPFVTVFFLIASAGTIITRPFFGRLVDRKSISAMMPLCFVAETVAMVLIAFAQSFVTIIVAGICRVFGQGSAPTAIQGQVMKDAPEDRRGVASSTYFMGADIGQGVGATAAGFLADSIGYTGSFLSCPVVLVVCLVPYLIWLREHKRQTSGKSA